MITVSDLSVEFMFPVSSITHTHAHSDIMYTLTRYIAEKLKILIH